MAALANYVFVMLLYVGVKIHLATQSDKLLPLQMKTENSGHLCQLEKQCTCYSETALVRATRVDCSSRNLTTVPEHLPNNTKSIDLSNNKIQNLGELPFVTYQGLKILNMSWNYIKLIGNHSFGNLKSVTHLDLQYCNIADIEADTFKGLTSLTYLDMSGNVNLTFGNLRNISYGLQFTTIKTLRLNSIHKVRGPCNTITEQQIEFLSKTNITELYLEYNRIAAFEVKAVGYIPRTLETFSAKGNVFMPDDYLFYMYFHFPAPKLKTLIVSYEDLSHVLGTIYYLIRSGSPNEIPSEMQLYSRSEEFELSNLRTDVYLPKHLSYVDLSNSNFKQAIYLTRLTTPNNLTHLLMNNNIIWKLIGPMTGFDNLTFLDLSGNYCENISLFALQNMPNLLHLNLSTNFLGFALDKDEHGKTFQGQSRLKNLDLSNNKIRELPIGIFDWLINLQMLNLSQNMLFEFHIRFDNMTKLKYLSLSDNMLETIPRATRHGFDRLAPLTNLTLNLEANHFRCSCNATHQDFLSWMIQTRVHVSEVTCFFDNGSSIVLSNRHQLSDIYHKLVKECSSYLLLLVVSVSLALLAIFITVSAVVYRFRWNLRYMYYMTKFKFKGYMPLPNDRRRYKYDVFVSYADDDRGFVRNKIVEKLENDNKGVIRCPWIVSFTCLL